MSETPFSSPQEAPEPRRKSGCLTAFVIIALALIATAAGLFIYSGEFSKRLVDSGFDKVKEIASSFFTTEIKTSASDVLLEIGRTHGDVLEVASPTKTLETFSQKDSKFAAWGWMYMGTTTTEIKVPATYRFHIKLSEIKEAKIDQGVLSVVIPEIHPSLPVAFDSAGIEKKAENTWLRFDAQEQLAALEKNITPALNARATGKVTVVRETARKDVEEFVQNWIVKANPEFVRDIKAVKVLFAGEIPENVKTEVMP